MGPLLFIIAINDFACSVDCMSVLYADDTTQINCSQNFEHLRTAKVFGMETVVRWFESDILTVNNNEKEIIILSLEQF